MPSDPPFRILYLETVVAEDVPALPTRMRDQIRRAIESRLVVDPVGYGKPLRYSLAGHRRLRVGDWRIVYKIDGARREVTISVIKHRKDVYAD